MVEHVLEFLDAEHDNILSRLKTYLRIPSVSPDPAFNAHMAEARQYLAVRLKEIGLHNVQELDGGGEPAVYGEWLGAPGKQSNCGRAPLSSRRSGMGAYLRVAPPT
jgi:acetylornithine deacetylase/succinyl-diaminopimelate desuccinylase-like protein